MTISLFVRRGSRIASGLAAVGLTLASADAGAQSGARAFERLDSDHDGVIQKREIEAARRKAFERADANDDDYVTGQEIEALREEIAEQYGRGGAPRGRAPAGMREAPADRVKAADADGDGRISETEFVSGADPLLQRFDGDGDGNITRAEMDEGVANVREEIRRRRETR